MEGEAGRSKGEKHAGEGGYDGEVEAEYGQSKAPVKSSTGVEGMESASNAKLKGEVVSMGVQGEDDAGDVGNEDEVVRR